MNKEKAAAVKGQGQEVEHLQAVLEHETLTRQQQEGFNSKLQEEYDVLLKKLAAAELHIDRLRLRANVDVNKRFIVSHDSIQSSVLQQGLDVRYSPGGWGGALNSNTGMGEVGDPMSGLEFPSEGVNGDYWREKTMPPSYSPGNGGVQGTPVTIQGNTPLPPNSVSPNGQHGLSKQSPGFHEEAHLQRDSSQSFLQDIEAPDGSGNMSAPHLLLSQTISDTHSESLSQMSTSHIKTQASAESQHLSQIFRIRSLQEQIASLKEKLSGNQSSFEELSEDLSRILEEHEALTGNFELSRQQLESLQERYKDKASRVISQRKAALENEVS